MKSRPKNRGLLYERRSDDNQEESFRQQYDWAKAESEIIGVPFRGTYADIEEMQRKRLHHRHDIYIDNAISGGDLTRPGLRKFLHDAITDKTVSHVYVFKRDRLGRPQGLIEMMELEHKLVSSGVTLVTHDKIYTPRSATSARIPSSRASRSTAGGLRAGTGAWVSAGRGNSKSMTSAPIASQSF